MGLSPATTSSYNSGVNRYLTFCHSYSLSAFPLTELTLCRFVAFLVHEGLSYSSIRLYLCALRHRQLLDGGNDPALHSLHRLHYVLRGCHRSLPLATRPRRLPITPSILRLLHHCWSNLAQNYDIVCMWAACCIGFFGFLRSGEFTCKSWAAYDPGMLSLRDVAIDNRLKPSVLHLTLRQSKTDVFGAGVTLHLGRTGDTILCPVSALLAYLAIRPPTPGPLFLLNSGDPLSRDTLVTTVRHTLSSAGLEVSQFNGHSFRIGAATAASQAGIPDSTIKSLGRWKSSAFTRYLRPPVHSIAANSRRLLHS